MTEPGVQVPPLPSNSRVTGGGGGVVESDVTLARTCTLFGRVQVPTMVLFAPAVTLPAGKVTVRFAVPLLTALVKVTFRVPGFGPAFSKVHAVADVPQATSEANVIPVPLHVNEFVPVVTVCVSPFAGQLLVDQSQSTITKGDVTAALVVIVTTASGEDPSAQLVGVNVPPVTAALAGAALNVGPASTTAAEATKTDAVRRNMVTPRREDSAGILNSWCSLVNTVHSYRIACRRDC